MADLLSTRTSRWESVLRLYNRLRSFLHDATGEKTQTSLGALLDEIVTYRNRVLGHGAPLDESHYRELASLFGDAFVEVFHASPFLTTLRLVSFPSIQLEAGSRIECEVIEHVGLQPARRAQPILRQLAQGSAPRKNALYLLDPAESLILLDPLLIAHRDDVYFLNEAGGAPEYLSYSSGERHSPASGGGALGEFFARIVGYTPDTSHLGRMGRLARYRTCRIGSAPSTPTSFWSRPP